MKNKLLLSIPVLVVTGSLYFAYENSAVLDPIGSTRASASEQQADGDKVAKPSDKLSAFNQLNTLYHRAVSAYDVSMSAVVYMSGQNQAKGNFDAPFIDIAINGTIHLGIFAGAKNPTAIAKLDNIAISQTKNKNATLDLEKSQALRQALAQPFAFEYSDQGTVINIHLPPGEDQFAAGVKRSIASRLQFILDHQAASTRTEDNESGKYIAEYTTKDFSTYLKKITKFVALAQGKPADSSLSRFNYSGSYIVDDKAQLGFLSATSSHVNEHKLMPMKAESEIVITYKSASDQVLTMDMIHGFAISSLHHKNQGGIESQQQLAAKDQMSVAKFMQKLTSLDPTKHYKQIWEERELLVQSILADGANLDGLAKAFEGKLTDAQQSLLLGVLKDAGTPEAQAALVGLVENERLTIKTRQHALSHMTFIEQPSEATVDYLAASIARAGGNPEMKATAVLALGGIIKSGLNPLDSFEPAYTGKLQSALHALEQGFTSAADPYERNAYLMAIGNAAQDSSVPKLMQLTSSKDAELRALSVDSLRFQKGEAIDNRVIAMMASDEDAGVQINAARSTVYRDNNPQLDTALLQNAKSAKSEDVRIASLGSLDFRNRDVADITAHIQTISKTDSSPKVRDFAEQLYKSRIESEQQLAAAKNPTPTGANTAADPVEVIPLELIQNEGTQPGKSIPAVR